MEKIKESKAAIANNKGSPNELNYDIEFIVQLNDLAKKVTEFTKKVLPIRLHSGGNYQKF